MANNERYVNFWPFVERAIVNFKTFHFHAQYVTRKCVFCFFSKHLNRILLGREQTNNCGDHVNRRNHEVDWITVVIVNRHRVNHRRVEDYYNPNF